MYRIDPKRIDLAREFKAKPFGVHSPELQAVLNVMRGQPVEDKYVLVMTKPHTQWMLAELTAEPFKLRVLSERVFASLEEAEWFVFKARWEKLAGRKLEID